MPPSTPPADTLSFTGELQRKALHLLALVVPLGMLLLGRDLSVLLLVPAALAALAADVLRVRWAAFAAFIDRWFGAMMRDEERPPVGGPVAFNGATWVVVSAALLALLFPFAYAIPAFVAFMVADAAAALVGRRWGRHRWPGNRRTIEGSLAYAVVALALLALFPDLSWSARLAAAVVGAGLEALPRPLNDNLRVPIGMAAVLLVLA